MPQAAGMYYFSNDEDNWSRPAVILLHGAGWNHLYWPPELRRLQGQRIYAPDLPGHGKSEGIGRQSIADYARCVLDFMDELKLRKAVFVGHSMGGAIALELALHFGRRTLGAALLSSGARLRVSPELLHNTSSTITFPLALKTIDELSFGPQIEARLRESAMQRLAEVRPSVLYGDFLACDAYDVTSQLGRVKVPVQIICGMEDKMMPLHYSQTLHQKIKTSLLHTVDGAGHMVMLEHPLVIVNILQFFLSRIEYRPGTRD